MPYLQYIVVETTVHSGFTEEMFEKSEKNSQINTRETLQTCNVKFYANELHHMFFL